LQFDEYLTETILITPSATPEKAKNASIALRDLKMPLFAFSSKPASKAAAA
jgi:hypothetical protein